MPPAQVGLEKISGRLIELAGDLVGDDEPEPWGAGIDLAAIAWNLSFLPREKRAREMRELVGEIAEKADIDPDLLSVLLERLVERKRLLYPDDRRRVLKWEVRVSHRQIHVLAVAVLPGDA